WLDSTASTHMEARMVLGLGRASPGLLCITINDRDISSDHADLLSVGITEQQGAVVRQPRDRAFESLAFAVDPHVTSSETGTEFPQRANGRETVMQVEIV